MKKWILLGAVLLLSACSFTSTATPTPLGRLMFGLMVQEPEEYPPGWMCSPNGDIKNGVQSSDHPCACHRMNHSKDCDDVEQDTHDPGCKSYCHEKHCACKVTCEMPK